MYNYYVPYMNDDRSLFYDPYNGFIKGNMFQKEYMPYRNITNFPIKPTSERDELLNQIQAYSFALNDLDLYLDLHRDDEEAIKLYQNYLNQCKKVTLNYETKYGPLSLNSEAAAKFPWAWVEGPWPWEVK